MGSFFKDARWEAPRLRDAIHRESARGEVCASCGSPGIVPAHANWEEYGKAKGLKAHDCHIAELCDLCHKYVDNQQLADATGVWGDNAEDRKEFWRRAHAATLVRWARRGWIKPT